MAPKQYHAERQRVWPEMAYRGGEVTGQLTTEQVWKVIEKETNIVHITTDEIVTQSPISDLQSPFFRGVDR